MAASGRPSGGAGPSRPQAGPGVCECDGETYGCNQIVTKRKQTGEFKETKTKHFYTLHSSED